MTLDPPTPDPADAAAERLSAVHLRLAEALATQIVAGRFSRARTEQLAHLALTRATRDHDPAQGKDFETACLPRLRRDLQNMADRSSARSEQRTSTTLLRLCVDVAAEGDSIRVTGLSVEDLVRRLERGHHADTRIVVHDGSLAGATTSDPREGPGRGGADGGDTVRPVPAVTVDSELAARPHLGVRTVLRAARETIGVPAHLEAVVRVVRRLGRGPDHGLG